MPKSKRPAARPAPTKRPAPRKRDDPLVQLEAAELVRRLSELDPTYIFKHALTQESAYQSLLTKRRREIHRDVAQVYEEIFAHQLDEYAALLARHYTEAGDEAKALEYESRAGDVATRVYANTEAIEHYTRAIALATRTQADSQTLTHFFSARGRVFELQGIYAKAMANYAEMEALAHERNDRAMELASLSARVTILSTPTTAHDPKEAEVLTDRALELARTLKDRAAEARILWNMMFLARWGWQRPLDAVRFGEQSLAIARELQLEEQVAFTLNDLGIHGYLNSGQLPQALTTLEEARGMWRQMNNLPMLADSFSGSSIAYFSMGRYDEAIAAADEAWRISESVNNPWGKSYSRWIVGDVYLDRGEPEHAAQLMEESIHSGEQAGFVAATVGVRNNLAMLYGHMGLPARGIGLAQLAREAAESGLPSWVPWCVGTLARLYVLQGEIALAKAMFRLTNGGPIQVYLFRWFSILSYPIALAEIEIALAENDAAHANATADFLIQHAQRIGAHSVLPDAYLRKGAALIALNQLDIALQTFLHARDIALELGARRMLWQIYAAMARLELARGNAADAERLRTKAREVVDYIAAHASGEMREAFLAQGQVKEILA